MAQLGQIPLRFEQNLGQTDPHVRYIARAGGYTAFLTDDEIVWTLSNENERAAIALRPLAANPTPGITPGKKLSGVSNYLRGTDERNWVTGAKAYSSIRYEDVWDGVDIVFREGSTPKVVEYDLVVSPGASVATPRFALTGADDLSIRDGDLVIDTRVGHMTQRAPRAYQVIDGRRRDVESSFVLRADELSFEVGHYDVTQPLIIDPEVLSYSTYLGGAGSDSGNGIAVDSSGFSYVAGNSSSTAFPVCTGVGTPPGCAGGAFDSSLSGTDAFVTKLSVDGSQLVYSTFFGGAGTDFADDIALDGSGNAYIGGGTDSADFPVCTGVNTPTTGCVGASFQTVKTSGDPNDGSDTDGFVTKLSAGGTSLVYSTFLGGADGYDEVTDITVDSSGNAYVTGLAGSSAFPVCTGVGTPIGCSAAAFDTTQSGGDFDAFVTNLNPTGSGLAYSTYLGGADDDIGFGIAVNGAGNAFVTGETFSTDFPVCTAAGVPSSECVAAARQTSSGGNLDGFVTKLSSTGTGLVYSTYHGGSSRDGGAAIAVDVSGNAYVGGFATSTNFPVCISNGNPSGCGAAAFDTSKAPLLDNSASNDGFVSKFNATGTGISYSTYLGGLDIDQVSDLAIDGSGQAYVTGATSNDFPVCTAANVPTGCTGAAVQPTHGGDNFDAFAAMLNPTGTGLGYSTYLGGPANDIGNGIAVDADGGAYVTGRAGPGFPVCTAAGSPRGCEGAAFDTSHGGGSDVFVTKVVLADFLPDALIRKGSTGTFLGDGIYRADAAGQTIFTRIRRGKTAVFELQFQNDGVGPVDAYNIHGCGSAKGYRVRFRDANGTDVTSLVTQPFGPTGYSTGNMDPGEIHSLTLRIKATQNARRTLRCPVTVTSEEDPTFFDTIRADGRVRG